MSDCSGPFPEPSSTPELPLEHSALQAHYSRVLVCTAWTDARSYWAIVQGVSLTGAELILSDDLKPNDFLHLKLRPRASVDHLGVSARVVRSTRLAGACWSAGCVFDRPLTEAELNSLL